MPSTRVQVPFTWQKKLDESVGHELTDGDSLDQAPSWVDGEVDKLVYQSAGLARSERGGIALIGPYLINELDLSTGEVTTLLEDAEHDLLLPHKRADGSLIFIQRPYEAANRPSYGRMLLDVLLLPWRLIETLFHFLNLMSLLYSGKPLTQAGARRGREPDLRKMILWGRAVEAEKRAQSYRPDQPRVLAPKSWVLIQRSKGGSEKVLSEAVIGFDVASDGTVIFTDGRGVFVAAPDGQPEKVLDYFPIEKITALS